MAVETEPKPAAAAAPKPEPPRRLYVCAGRRWSDADAHLAYHIYRVNEDGSRLDDAEVYEEKPWKKRHTAMWSGGVFSIAYDPEKERTLYIDARFVRQWESDQDRAAWQALDRAAALAERLSKESKASRDRDSLGELLLPLRKEYAKLIARADRQAFELAVLDALRKRPPL